MTIKQPKEILGALQRVSDTLSEDDKRTLIVYLAAHLETGVSMTLGTDFEHTLHVQMCDADMNGLATTESPTGLVYFRDPMLSSLPDQPLNDRNLVGDKLFTVDPEVGSVLGSPTPATPPPGHDDGEVEERRSYKYERTLFSSPEPPTHLRRQRHTEEY